MSRMEQDFLVAKAGTWSANHGDDCLLPVDMREKLAAVDFQLPDDVKTAGQLNDFLYDKRLWGPR